MPERPLLLLTMGDVAGIGPEIIAKAWPELVALCRPVVVGDANWLRRALALVGSPAHVVELHAPEEARPTAQPDCWPNGSARLSGSPLSLKIASARTERWPRKQWRAHPPTAIPCSGQQHLRSQSHHS